MSCLSDDAIAEFVEGSMPAEEAARVDHHMAECAACRSLVADAAKIAFDTSGEVTPSDSASSSQLRIPQPGDLVGRYRILRIIGVGGMGVVYAGEDPELGRRIALKLIRTDLVTTSGIELRTRLHHEARAMARISHPNVVVVHDIGTIGRHLFVAMEYVHGKTLREWLASKNHGWAEILDTFLAAGNGLAAAHAVGLVHRDFKPENVLCGEDGRVRVTDFGLARGGPQASELASSPRPIELTDPEGPPVTMTRTGQLLGTPAYMAPEQLLGSAADARSDQFSFSVALFEALYKVRPFPAKDVRELASKIASGQVPAAPSDTDVPTGLHVVLARALRSNPLDRFPSMQALLGELSTFRPKSSEARRSLERRELAPHVDNRLPTAGAASPNLAPSPAESSPAPHRRRAAVVAFALCVIGAGAWIVEQRRTSARKNSTGANESTESMLGFPRTAGDNECTRGKGLYCGGHGVDGELGTLYRCTDGSITEVKKCSLACLHLVGGAVDACNGDTTRCPLGSGVYCGSNHLSADPKTLYRCSDGTVTVERACPVRCVNEPDRIEDHCE
jgi:serine/threonine protein kinase